MPKTSAKTVVLQTRIEEDLLTAIRQLREGNQIGSDSEMSRLLIRRGIRAIAEGENTARKPHEDLTQDAYIQRSIAFEHAAISNIQQAELQYPSLAEGLARSISQDMTVLADAIAKRYPEVAE